VATAGSIRETARVAPAKSAAGWQSTRSGDVVVASGTGPGVSLEGAVGRYAVDRMPAGVRAQPAVVLPLKISPGVLADRALDVADKHGLLSAGTLAESPLFLEVLVDRLRSRPEG
jgi:sirohydrochlorin ferrochelatase